MQKPLLAGINAINQALDNLVTLSVLYLEENKDSKRLNALRDRATALAIDIEYKSRLQLDLMAIGAKHQGAVAEVLKKPSDDISLDDILLKENPLLLMLDGVEDPHNLGACLRSAAAAGVDAVILPKNHSASITPTVSKVASGGAEAIPIFYVDNLNRVLEKIQGKNFWSVALAGDAISTIYELDFSQIQVIVMGGEQSGIHKQLKAHCDYQAKIPMTGKVESLNVSVATGIVLFEAMRQKITQ